MTASQPIPVIVAAGGDGSRMAGNKPTQLFDGISLIERALTLVSAMSPTIAVAVQQNASWTIPVGVVRLYDETQGAGPLSALSSALTFAVEQQASHALVVPCDMPFLPADLLGRLVDEIGSAAVAMVKSADRLHPICALWSVTTLSMLSDYAATSRRSLIGFAERSGMVTVEWPAQPFDPFFNVNTPQDLVLAHKILEASRVST